MFIMWKKALVGAFNQEIEKALVGYFSVIVKSPRTFVWSSSSKYSEVAAYCIVRGAAHDGDMVKVLQSSVLRFSVGGSQGSGGGAGTLGTVKRIFLTYKLRKFNN